GRAAPWKYALARLYPAFPEGAPVPEAKDWREAVTMRRSVPVTIGEVGTFRATDVPPGDWRFDAMVFIERPGEARLRYAGGVRELPSLKESWETMKKDADVVVVGLSSDATEPPVRAFVAEQGYGWTQAVLGEKSKVARDWGIVSIPTMWLVLPDGTLADTSAGGVAGQIAAHRRKGAAGAA